MNISFPQSTNRIYTDEEIDEWLRYKDMEYSHEKANHDEQRAFLASDEPRTLRKEIYNDILLKKLRGEDVAYSELNRYSDRYLDINEIRSKPIVEYIKMNGFRVISSGPKRYKMVCPFHKDSAPSLTIYENTNSWYCFGCNKGGSIIDFAMLQNGCSFKEAILWINNY